jgi:hypothetical protein
MPTDRRSFLERLTVGAMAATVLPGVLPATLDAAPAPRAAHDLSHSMSPGEREAMAGVAPLAEEWDVSWTKKLTGKHRAVFDSPAVDSGAGVMRSALWLRQYADVLKATPADLHSVIVLRHDAIILAMAQPFWDEYELGKKNKVTSPITDKKTTRNPALLTAADGASPGFAAMALDKQMAAGAIVLACGLAFNQMVGEVTAKHKIKGDEARARALAGLIPGVIMQPSGFFATTLAQENGCIYVRAS